jgi:Ribose/xylose/arabinose/galactoside ABC-type transport systems, permease components
MASAMLIGLINGVLIAKFKVPSYLVTLATMVIAEGVAQRMINNRSSDSIGPQAEGFKNLLYYGELFSIGELTIHIIFVIVIVIFLIFNFILNYTKTGHDMYAVGNNIEESKVKGINADSTIVKAYLVSSFCAGLVGLIVTARNDAGILLGNTGWGIYAVFVAAIGGISVLGGKGRLIGVLVGAFALGLFQHIASSFNMTRALGNTIIGILLIAFTVYDVYKNTKKSKEESEILV